MGIRVKLGHYVAEEEPHPPFSAGKLWVVLTVLTVPLAVVYWLSFGGPSTVQAAPSPETARGNVEARVGVQAETGAHDSSVSSFASSNWRQLERGVPAPTLKTLDTDLESPDWQGREVYKELKAMAVYECKSKPATDRTRRDFVEKVLREKGAGS